MILLIKNIYNLNELRIEKEELEKKKISGLDLKWLNNYKKIDISDAIYVVNVDGYIGTSTKKEIEYAKSLNKEIFSLEPLNY